MPFPRLLMRCQLCAVQTSTLLHHFLEVLCYLAEEVVACVASVDAVIAVRVRELSEILVSLHEGFGILCRIAEVDVIIGHAMNEEQLTAKLRGTTDGANIVA